VRSVYHRYVDRQMLRLLLGKGRGGIFQTENTHEVVGVSVVSQRGEVSLLGFRLRVAFGEHDNLVGNIPSTVAARFAIHTRALF